MPINFQGMNSDYIKLFELEEYIDKIKLSPYILMRSEEVNRDFDKYMKKLAQYENEEIINFWVHSMYNELKYNQRIENTKFNIASLADRTVFFDTLNITHKRIHELHNFVIEKEINEGILVPTDEYRNVPVNVSRFTEDGKEEIFWRGVNPEDVQAFMNNFIRVYKSSAASSLFNNPFLASSLMHLLFLRIHPYTDGNGRTARVIHNIKFTEMINKIHGMRLKLSPLNLSESIALNKITYVKVIDNIYFDVEHDTNAAINKWFEFILNMADEQLYRSSNKLDTVDVSSLERMTRIADINADASAMRLSRIKRKKS